MNLKPAVKRWSTGIAALLLALSLAACGNETKDNQTATQEPAKQESQQTQTDQQDQLKTTYPLTLQDATGQSFTFKEAPKKIVSVSPAETEALFAIGLGDEIVGVSDYDDYPEAVKSKPKMGGIMKPNEEAMIAAQPDVVFTGISMSEDAVKKLRELQIPIFKTAPKTVDDVMKNIETYGQITDHQAEAQKVVDQMKEERDKIVQAVKSLSEDQKKKVYIEFSPGWTVGKGEFMDELIMLAGGINVAADTQGWNQISEEKIIKDNPDVILFAKSVVDDKTKKGLGDIIKGRSGWDQITAVKNGNVIGMDDNLLSRPGPRVTQGLLEVAKAIYPELFK
ncbi:ABC transporter substrate-binding protein [Paenibacillus sp.]|jgi:iron complex transport system substrate-binding protein|uniref:ABC transporter substrate-binding protein n=1 Tax=Paenibacillus sp. TaxID=58172 RepID=UPI002818594B|nr:ABC transporter substrate-binding protein [Paenibacillus sp.]MDR0269804.1 ABC transporter substrate-binding protein [Paenibacillus sp.]